MNRFVKTLSAVALAAGLVASAQAADRITYKVVGQPAATGKIQTNKEKPFFENFAERTGLSKAMGDERQVILIHS